MVKIYNLDQIKEVLKDWDPIQAIEAGFVAYSQGKTVIPPIGELLFKDPPGEMHIKYGCIIGTEYYVIKVASGFYENYKLNLPNYDGLMLVFSQKTGLLLSILLDECHLTNIRTAAAGAVAAKYLAPKNITKIGIFGAGMQGRMQLEYLRHVTPCKEVYAWGINSQEIEAYKQDMEAKGYSVHPTLDTEEVAANCNLIVTATPAKKPLLREDQVRPGTHITAMGSDTPEKNELAPEILRKADIVVADSLSQCQSRGEISKALEAGAINMEKVVELGTLISNPELHRSSDEQITIADLTGVAIQDIQISVAVYEALTSQRK
jgi:ornithine cyclodeaminase